jgi:hypothetical protein
MKTADILITRTEGADWEIIEIHSMVSPDGMRWDAINQVWRFYPHSVAEIKANQERQRLLDQEIGL